MSMLEGDRGRLLDAGCGDGSYAASRGWNVTHSYTGVDLDEEAIEAAKDQGLNARVGDVTDIDEPDDKFDIVVAKAVLEHVPNHLAAARECRRVLKPGGEFVAIVPSDRSYDVWGDYTHLRAYRRDALVDLLVDAGFDRSGIEVEGRMGWNSIGMALKSIGRMVAPWTPYGYPRAWLARAEA